MYDHQTKDHKRPLTDIELRDIRRRENREGHPYSDRDMLLDHIDAITPKSNSVALFKPEQRR